MQPFFNDAPVLKNNLIVIHILEIPKRESAKTLMAPKAQKTGS
jgi:hypothetical protein